MTAKVFIYQLTLRGYDGSTDATDDLVKWIAAPDEAAARRYADSRADWEGHSDLEKTDLSPYNQLDTGEMVLDGVDVIVDETGSSIGRRTLNRYHHCGRQWETIWDSGCNDSCPVCEAEIEPYLSEGEED